MEAEVSLFESCAVAALKLQLCFAEESSARSEFAGILPEWPGIYAVLAA